MIPIKVLHKDPSEIMEIVRELRNSGLIQGRDFDFAYNQAKYNNDGWEAVEPKTTVFTFYQDKLATLFVLKYL